MPQIESYTKSPTATREESIHCCVPRCNLRAPPPQLQGLHHIWRRSPHHTANIEEHHCQMQLEKTTGPLLQLWRNPEPLSQLKRDPESPATTRERPYVTTQEEPSAAMTEGPCNRTGEEIPTIARGASRTSHLQRRPSATNIDEPLK